MTSDFSAVFILSQKIINTADDELISNPLVALLVALVAIAAVGLGVYIFRGKK